MCTLWFLKKSIHTQIRAVSNLGLWLTYCKSHTALLQVVYIIKDFQLFAPALILISQA